MICLRGSHLAHYLSLVLSLLKGTLPKINLACPERMKRIKGLKGVEG